MMHHLKALISQSPEELPEAFFKEFKKFNSDYKIKVWSRKDPLPKDYDFYFLSHRDYVFLKKHNQLPLRNKIVLLATSISVESSFSGPVMDQICCFIAGNEEARGRLAADYFINACKMSLGVLPLEIEAVTAVNFLDEMKIPFWMKELIHQSLLELMAWKSHRQLSFQVTEEEEHIIILASVEGELPSLELFCHTFHHSHLHELNQNGLKLLTLKSLFHRVSQTIIYLGKSRNTIFELKFKKAKTQKKYENFPKLFGLNQLRIKNV
jgi:hypothetical protein